MLHRSFKPAKCKTSLKLATSRIKLLKNKKGEQVKQLKRELAKLLESGQEQTARIRVEHVVREEKTMAAYDLIEIYCELIVARLPIIESQKNCPIDLKEAISSAIFAAPRCADIPELMDVRKHFTAKYGKEFVSAAVELRPDCGVSRLLVEKLSAKAPDGPTKIKILKAIADEHNVNWDHELLAEKESKPPDDLLNGPSTFENAGRIPMNPPNVQAPPSPYDKAPSNVQVPYRSNERNDVPETYVARPPPPPPFDYSETANNTASYGPPGSDTRTSGTGVQGTEFRDADGSTFSPGRQNWNMEFKDATAAAQAAAESAERASMAARAAAQIASHGNMSRQHSSESRVRDEMPKKDARTTSQNLKDAEFSGRGSMSRQHTTESHKSARDEAPQKYAGSTGQRGHRAGDPVNSSRHESYSGMHREQIRGNKAADLPEQSGSFESSPSSFDGETSVDELEKADTYSRRNPSGKFQTEHFGDVNTKSASSENIDYHDEVRIRKQPSNSSSHSHSSSFGNDRDGASSLFARDSQKDLAEEPFVNDIFESHIKETHPYDNASMAFDDSGSDDDRYNVDLDHSREKHESSFGFSPPGQQSSSHLSHNADSWSPRQNVESQSHFFTEEESAPMPSESPSRSSVTSLTQDLPVTFDNSDGPSSESEEELEKPKISRKESVVEATDDSDEPVEEPGSESDKELKLGNLIGGLRNKGLRRPPYSRIHQNSASSSIETAPVIEQPPPPSTGASILRDISSDDDSDVELPKPTLRSSTEEKYDQSGSIGRNRKPISTAPLPFFDSDSDEDLPKRTSVNDSQPKTVFSRRTKTSPSSTDKPSSFRTSVLSEPSETVGSAVENKSFSRRSQPPPEAAIPKTRHQKREPELQDSHDQFPEPSMIHSSRRSQAPETVSKTRPQKRESNDQFSEPSTTRSSSNTSFSIRSQATEPSRNTRPQMKDSEIQERYDRLRMEQASVTKPVSETRKPSVDDSSRSERKKPSETRKPSVDDSSRSERKKPANAASEKSPSGSGEGSKPSHVHPKLPDFDTLSAHFQSLRQNR